MTVVPEFVVKINGIERGDIPSGSFRKEPRDPINIPLFTFTLPDPFGDIEQELESGDVVELYKNTSSVFTGVLENVDISDSDSESMLTITCSNKWYKKMSNVLCDSYDFIQDINDYGITVNTWDYKVIRSTNPEHALQDLTKAGPPIDGFTADQVAKALIGEKLLYWHDFEDGSHLLSRSTRGISDGAGGWTVTPSNLGVYRNPGLSAVAEIISGGHAVQSTPRLQLQLNGEVYQASGVVESIPFYNGDPNVDVMGNISNATIRVYGEFPDDTGITVEVTRSGGESDDSDNDFLGVDYPARAGTWVTVVNVADAGTTAPSTKSVSYSDILGNTGVNASYKYYEGSTDFSGKAVGNSFAYKITLTTSNTDFTPYIEYIKFECDTVSDTGLVSGAIDPYADAAGITGSEYFEGDLVSQNRLQALSALRFGTINVDDELNHFWDIWLDEFGTLNFKKNRGSLLTREYSFDNKDFGSIQYKKDGSDIWKQCIAYGAGSGKYRTRIVSDEDFSTGGLKSAATALEFGDAAKVGKYEDTNATTAAQLLRKARAVFKLHQKKMASLTIPSGFFDLNTYDFEIGDSIKIVIPSRGINGYFPVEDIEENLEGEPVSVQLGEPRGSLENAIGNISTSSEQVHVVRGATGGTSGLTGSGTLFDKDTIGLYTFGISNTKQIDKVFLKAQTIPWTVGAKAAASQTITLTTTAASNTLKQANQTLNFGGGAVAEVYSGTVTIPSGGTTTNSNMYCTVRAFKEAGSSATTYINRIVAYVDVGAFDRKIVHDMTGLLHFDADTDVVYTFPIDTEFYDFRGEDLKISIDFDSVTELNKDNVSVTTFTERTHSHGITMPGHVHDLDYGIYQFAGDSPGSGPMYATNVKMWVDLESTELASPPSDKLLNVLFGDPDKPVQLDAIDITPWLSRDASGLITEGMHNIAIKSDSAFANNANGLGNIQLVVYYLYKE